MLFTQTKITLSPYIKRKGAKFFILCASAYVNLKFTKSELTRKVELYILEVHLCHL